MIMLQPELNVLLISMDVTFFGMSRFLQDKVRLAAIKITHFSIPPFIFIFPLKLAKLPYKYKDKIYKPFHALDISFELKHLGTYFLIFNNRQNKKIKHDNEKMLEKLF